MSFFRFILSIGQVFYAQCDDVDFGSQEVCSEIFMKLFGLILMLTFLVFPSSAALNLDEFFGLLGDEFCGSSHGFGKRETVITQAAGF